MEQILLSLFVLLALFLPKCDILVESKTSRVRTNYKLRVGEDEDIGRYTEYSQVRIPPNGKFRSEEGARYYRHAKGARITKSSHFDYEYELGHKIVFICVARGKPRPKIVWFKDGVEIYHNPYYHSAFFSPGNNFFANKKSFSFTYTFCIPNVIWAKWIV